MEDRSIEFALIKFIERCINYEAAKIIKKIRTSKRKSF